ncbi:MAG: DUF2333 family protein [Thermodesulfobacteriota bacterium]
MKPNSGSPGGKVPMPLPPEQPPPRESKLGLLLKQRFFLVALVILIFLGILFTWETRHPSETVPEPAAPALEAPPETVPPALPQGAEAEAPKAPEPPKAPAHPAPPPPALPKEKFKGEAFTNTLVKIMDDQVNQTLFGWRPNTILFGKLGLTDNVNNLQLGVLEVARRTIVVLNEHMTRFAITEAYNPRVNEAMNFFMVSPDKYWFPSASGKYREAMHDLETYIEDLKRGRSRFYTRVDNLIALLANYKDILGSSYHNLIKDTEADGSPVSWFKTDDYFYFSQGVALGMSQMLEAVKEDFHEQLQRKGSHKLLDDAIHALHSASHLSPWVVTDGAKDGILANHRANMSTYIGEAEHVVATLQTVLATN